MNPSTLSGKATAMAKLKEILDRIDQARPVVDGKPMADQQISNLATGKPRSDLIRNWRRAVRDGKDVSARMDTVDAVADVIGVSAEWLREGTGDQQMGESDAEAALFRAIKSVPAGVRSAAARAALATVQAIRAASSEES